jgi:hypothetical protein
MRTWAHGWWRLYTFYAKKKCYFSLFVWNTLKMIQKNIFQCLVRMKIHQIFLIFLYNLKSCKKERNNEDELQKKKKKKKKKRACMMIEDFRGWDYD